MTSVVVVETPGTPPQLWAPLLAALGEARVVAFPCSGTPSDFQAAIRAAVPEGATVVAHGIGATLALQSGARAGHWVVLGPVLGGGPVGRWAPGRCMAPSLATADWTFDPATAAAPVTVLVGARDDVAPAEVVVPESRRFPQRTLVRLGLGRFDPRDQDHGELITDPVAIAATKRAVRR